MSAFVEKEFKYKGYSCVVIFQSLGYRTAYINVGNTKYRSVDYEDIPLDIHGGLTYSSNTLYGQEYNASDWWIGWDYGHYGDGTDFERALTLFGDDENICISIKFNQMLRSRFENENMYVYTVRDCMRDCMNAVDQIIVLRKR